MNTPAFDFSTCFAGRARRMKASEIRELLKLLSEHENKLEKAKDYLEKNKCPKVFCPAYPRIKKKGISVEIKKIH